MNTEWYKTGEERQMAQTLIDMERKALNKFMNGDTSLYAELWSQDSFSYHDMGFYHRVDTYEEIRQFLDNLNGKLKAESYEFSNPRVQFAADGRIGILCYRLIGSTNHNDMRYHCVEVFERQKDGQWKVIHSTWAVIRPFEMDFSKIRKHLNIV